MPAGRRGLVVPQNTFLENVVRRSNGLRKYCCFVKNGKQPLKINIFGISRKEKEKYLDSNLKIECVSSETFPSFKYLETKTHFVVEVLSLLKLSMRINLCFVSLTKIFL